MKLAAIQMRSGPDRDDNLQRAAELLGEAARRGAGLAVLPEYFSRFGLAEEERVAGAEPPGRGPVQDFLQTQARRHGIWLVGGTLPLSGTGSRPRSACLFLDPEGRMVARYDKLHLFDVDAGDGREYRESAWTEPGTGPVVADGPAGRLGLAVCYDMRFPEQFIAMSRDGAELFAVPSAFTAATGAAHWELLARSRAVDNLCYLVAGTQWGTHANGHRTWGHAMIVGPWGDILAELPEGEGVAVADMDRDALQALRRRFPVLEHRSG